MPLDTAALASRYGLAGRKALVTGGSRGIGRAIAEQLCAAGASVYVCALRGPELDGAVAEMRAAGHDVTVRPTAPCACALTAARGRGEGQHLRCKFTA
jgi:NAD(P)-dependent dehydrogenase (short-subunit alcohol dehydrogenase family)